MNRFRIFLLAATAAMTATACLDPGADPLAGAEQAATGDGDDNQSLCNPQSEEPPPRPGKSCFYEISLDKVTNVEGQGISEGSMELNVVASAGTSTTSWPGPLPATQEFVKGQSTLVGKGHVIDTFEVPEGTQRDVKVCANFTEVDNGGTNGGNDTGRACKTITLVAQNAPGDNVVCPSDQTPVVATDLCGDNQCNGRFKARFEVLVADADNDGFDNDEDFTPDVCDEENKGQLGRASVVWFHMGDGPMTTFFQSAGTNLGKAFDGYDYKIAILDPVFAGPFLLNAAAIHDADLVLSPEEANLYLAMQEVTRRGYDLDLWIFSHGSQWTGSAGVDHTHFESLDTGECTAIPKGELCGNGLDDDEDGDIDEADCTAIPAGELCWNGADDDGDLIVDEDDGIWDHEIVQNLDPARIGTDLVPIRMTYSIACYAEGFNAAWQTVGAWVTSGTVGINFFPVFYGNFADEWNLGANYEDSVIASDKPGDRGWVYTWIDLQSATFDCDDVSLPDDEEETWSVLDTNACAEDFFIDSDGKGPDEAVYDIGDDYDPTLSGSDNMDLASYRQIDGTKLVGKFSPATLSW